MPRVLTFVISRIVRPAIGLVLSMLLASAVACGGNTTAPPSQPSSTAAQASSPTSTATRGPPPTLRPGDPAVYSDAIDRVQQWL
jgi:hypothetical protein